MHTGSRAVSLALGAILLERVGHLDLAATQVLTVHGSDGCVKKKRNKRQKNICMKIRSSQAIKNQSNLKSEENE
jgi:hypothetical protein